jgi:hypothetical protein
MPGATSQRGVREVVLVACDDPSARTECGHVGDTGAASNTTGSTPGAAGLLEREAFARAFPHPVTDHG